MPEEFEKRDIRKGSFLLIADDNQRDLNFMRRTLKEHHYRSILTFKNPWDAVELLESGVGDIFIINLENRIMKALDAVALIKKNPETTNVPVLVTSFDCTPVNVIAPRKAGADGVIVKPLCENGIVSQINRSATFLTSQLLRGLTRRLMATTGKGLNMDTRQKDKTDLLKPYCELLYYIIFAFPQFVRGYMELSKLFFEMLQDKRAIELLKRAAAIAPDAPGHPEALANYYAEMKLNEKSLHYAKQYADIVKDANSFGKLAENLLRCGKLEEAILTINLAISLQDSKRRMKMNSEELSGSLNVRGMIQQERGAEKEDNHLMVLAAEDFSRALELNPSLISAQYNLMITYQKMGNTQKAIEVLDRLKSMEPADAEGWLLMADTYFQEKDLQKTYFAIQKALSLKKESIRFKTEISKLLFKYNILDRAKEILMELIKADPSNPSLYNRLGLISRREGSVQNALKWYETGLSHDPEDAVIWFNMAKAYLDNGSIEAGNNALRKCKELDPELDISWHRTFEEYIEPG